MEQKNSNLEMQVSLKALGNFSDKMLEGTFVDEELNAHLILMDFNLSNGSGPVTMAFLCISVSGFSIVCSLKCSYAFVSVSELDHMQFKPF